MSYRNQQTYINNDNLRPANRQEQFSKQQFSQDYLNQVPKPMQYSTMQPNNLSPTVLQEKNNGLQR